MTYVAVLLWSALAMYGTRRLREPHVAIVALACVLATFVALRGPNVANDFVGYQEWYRLGANAEGLLERPPVLESLFFGLMTTASQTGIPFRLFVWVVAACAIALKFYCFRRVAKTGPALWAGITCYLFSDFLLHEFTQLRAGLAIALFMLALVYLGEGRIRAYLVFVAFGALIHSSALLGLVALPLSLARRGWLDLALLGVLLGLVLFRSGGLLDLEQTTAAIANLDARLALYLQLSAAGESEPIDPRSIRAMLILLLILTSYGALLLRNRQRHRGGPEPGADTSSAALLTLLRLIVMGQIALYLMADVKELGLRIMEFWMACLPLYAIHLMQTRGMKVLSPILWLWLAATFWNYVFRASPLVGPYSFG